MPSAHATDSFSQDRLNYGPTTDCEHHFVHSGQRVPLLCWVCGVVVLFVDVVIVVVVVDVGCCELRRWYFGLLRLC